MLPNIIDYDYTSTLPTVSNLFYMDDPKTFAKMTMRKLLQTTDKERVKKKHSKYVSVNEGE